MLYFVSVSGVDAGVSLDDYENFIVSAQDEKDLARAIVADRMDGMETNELDGAVWRVRELGDEFKYETELEFTSKGKRL